MIALTTLRLFVLAGGLASLTSCSAPTNSDPRDMPPHPANAVTLPKTPYLGQPVPGLTPELFAPGIVSTEAIELNGVFSPDGREFYFTRVVDGLDTMHLVEF